MSTLPEQLRSAFEAQDVGALDAALLSMPVNESERQMRRCIACGLWDPAAGTEGAAADAAAPPSLSQQSSVRSQRESLASVREEPDEAFFDDEAEATVAAEGEAAAREEAAWVLSQTLDKKAGELFERGSYLPPSGRGSGSSSPKATVAGGRAVPTLDLRASPRKEPTASPAKPASPRPPAASNSVKKPRTSVAPKARRISPGVGPKPARETSSQKATSSHKADALSGQLQTMATALDEERQARRTAEDELRAALGQIETLRSELGEAQRLASESERLSQETRRLEGENTDLTDENEELRNKLLAHSFAVAMSPAPPARTCSASAAAEKEASEERAAADASPAASPIVSPVEDTQPIDAKVDEPAAGEAASPEPKAAADDTPYKSSGKGKGNKEGLSAMLSAFGF